MAIYFKAKLNITKEYLQELKNIKPFLSMMKVNTDLMLRTVCLLTINNLFAIAGASLGTITLAANAVILEIIFIIVYFIDGMANGVSVFSGKALGNKNKVLLEKTLKIGLICLFIFHILYKHNIFLGKKLFYIYDDKFN